MHASETATEPLSANGLSDVQARTLIDVFLEGRSRRFSMSADLHGGAMDFKSAAGPVPLSPDEEAILAFAGSGVTGRVYGELPCQPLEGLETGGGQIMMSMVGRTQSSADAVATVTLFILRDDGTYAMRRPQDFALATEALGLGGVPHDAAHRFAWTSSLGCRMRDRTFAQVLHKGVLGTLLMRLLDKNITIPQAVGLDHDGTPIIKPYAPPYYPSMETAVRAFVASKFAPGTGFFRDAPGPSAWRDPGAVQAGIPEYSEANIQAVIAYCEYVMEHYGQFPANFGPIRTLMAFQAHHIDTAFYDRFYNDGAYTAAHARHFELWHPDLATAPS